MLEAELRRDSRGPMRIEVALRAATAPGHTVHRAHSLCLHTVRPIIFGMPWAQQPLRPGLDFTSIGHAADSAEHVA